MIELTKWRRILPRRVYEVIRGLRMPAAKEIISANKRATKKLAKELVLEAGSGITKRPEQERRAAFKKLLEEKFQQRRKLAHSIAINRLATRSALRVIGATKTQAKRAYKLTEEMMRRVSAKQTALNESSASDPVIAEKQAELEEVLGRLKTRIFINIRTKQIMKVIELESKLFEKR